jgi:hypothetical protein
VIDAYLCMPGQEVIWSEAWSRVTDAQGTVLPDQEKGYAEVAW